MRVLLATDTYEPVVNGISVFTEKLAERLADLGHEVVILSPAWPGNSDSVDAAAFRVLRVASLPVFVHPYTRISPLFGIAAARRILEDLRPEVVHIQTPWFIGATIARAAHSLHVPVVGTLHVRPENFVPYLPGLLRPLVASVFWECVSSVYTRLSRLVVPTTTAKVLVESHIAARMPVVISNGVDLNKFRPSRSVDGEQSRARKGPDKPVVLYVGRIDRDKAPDILLRVIQHAVRSIDCQVVICGSGSEVDMLQRSIRGMNLARNVTWTGQLSHDRVAELYRVASVFVMTGESETQPLAALEAMASGVPIVGFRAPGLADLVEDDVTGFLAAPGAVEDFCQKVVRLLADSRLRARLSRSARIEAERLHSFDATADQYIAVYREALRGRPDKATTHGC